MKKLIFYLFCALILCLSLACSNNTQSKNYDNGWDTALPEKYGYDATKLELAHQYIIDSMKTTGLVVVVGGDIIFSYGSIERVSYIASCRKSLLAMLYGKYVENGTMSPLRKGGL